MRRILASEKHFALQVLFFLVVLHRKVEPHKVVGKEKVFLLDPQIVVGWTHCKVVRALLVVPQRK